MGRSARNCGAAPLYARVCPIEPQVAIELASVAVADRQVAEFGRQSVEETLTVGGSIAAAKLVLGDVAADEPVPEREADVDGTAGLDGELHVNTTDAANETLEGEVDALGFPGFLGLAHERTPYRRTTRSRTSADLRQTTATTVPDDAEAVQHGGRTRPGLALLPKSLGGGYRTLNLLRRPDGCHHMSLACGRLQRMAAFDTGGIVPKPDFRNFFTRITAYGFHPSRWQCLSMLTQAPIATIWQRLTPASHAFARPGLRSPARHPGHPHPRRLGRRSEGGSPPTPVPRPERAPTEIAHPAGRATANMIHRAGIGGAAPPNGPKGTRSVSSAGRVDSTRRPRSTTPTLASGLLATVSVRIRVRGVRSGACPLIRLSGDRYARMTTRSAGHRGSIAWRGASRFMAGSPVAWLRLAAGRRLPGEPRAWRRPPVADTIPEPMRVSAGRGGRCA